MVTPKKTAAPKAAAKKPIAAKPAEAKPAIKKGSKLACKVCGFAITVDRVCGCMEEAHLVCCDTPMHVKKPVAKKK
jgi:hypothetical protein